MKLCRHAIPAVCAIALTGCVTIPMDGDLPYDGVKDNIDSGSTTRTDVLFALGEPNLARRDETLFVYSGYELEGKLILVAAGVADAGGGGGTGAAMTFDLGKQHLLAIQFDDAGVVGNLEILNESDIRSNEMSEKRSTTNICITTGECFAIIDKNYEGVHNYRYADETTRKYKRRPNKIIVSFATAEEDSKAKLFESNHDQCILYVYPGGKFGFSVYIDSAYLGYSIDRGYFLWRADPGEHNLGVSSGQDTAYFDSISFTCQPGEQIYVRLDPPQSGRLDPVIVDVQEGQAGVRSGKLLLTW